MDIDTTNIGDTWETKHKVGGPWTKRELRKAKIYGKHSSALFTKAHESDLSTNATFLIHHLLLRHADQRAITYKEFYCIGYLKDKPFPIGPALRRELEEKGFILSHCDVGKIGEPGHSVGDICEFLFITEKFPCG